MRNNLTLKERLSVAQWLTAERCEAFKKSKTTAQHVIELIKKELNVTIVDRSQLVRLMNQAEIPDFLSDKKPDFNTLKMAAHVHNLSKAVKQLYEKCGEKLPAELLEHEDFGWSGGNNG